MAQDEEGQVTDLDKLEQLAGAATPGPWEADIHGNQCLGIHRPHNHPIDADHFDFDDCPANGAIVVTDGGYYPPVAADAAFIAAANPAAVLELIAEVRRLNTIIDLGRGTLDRMHAQEQQSHQDWSTIRAELTETKERLREAEAIVRDLAACNRPTDSDYGDCLLCGDQRPCAPSCPHRRAVEATKP